MSETETVAGLTALVAMTPTGVIGRDGDLPWKLSSDLRRFKQRTMGGVLIMGRKTYESIGRPLPGRETIVITRNLDWPAVGLPDGVHRVDGPGAAVNQLQEHFAERAGYVVGGAQIYQALLPRCERVLLTRVLGDIEGETVLDFDFSDFSVAEQTSLAASDRDQYPTEFLVLVRRPAGERILDSAKK